MHSFSAKNKTTAESNREQRHECLESELQQRQLQQQQQDE